jgi:hypothetical protein
MSDTRPNPGGEAGSGLVTLRVEIRAEYAAILWAFAAREGTSVEALATLWLEEKAAEARKLMPRATGAAEGK